MRNVELVLTAAGARLDDVVIWSFFVVEGASLQEAFAAFQEVWGERGDPPAITVAHVVALASPAFLVEATAVAVVTAP